MPPERTKNQDESALNATLAQTVRDVAKLEIRVDTMAEKLAAVNLKATMALSIQIINLGGVIFIITKMFEMASKL